MENIKRYEKPHKFFEKYLDNNLTSLTQYLEKLHSKIVNDNLLRLPQDIFEKHNKLQDGAATMTGDYYNIFTYTHPAIVNLYKGLSETMDEVCDYYGIDRKEQNYMIHGWFNFDYPAEKGQSWVSPIYHSEFFHDHSRAIGAPEFHGYYCVNAEPSKTFYQIGKDSNNIFENINKNNRLVISETGHPHGKDDWYEESNRITIAYDIMPLKLVADEQHIPHKAWIPLI